MKRVFSILLITLTFNTLQGQIFEMDGINYNITSAAEPYSVEVFEKTPKYARKVFSNERKNLI